jgi:hypothetical protein
MTKTYATHNFIYIMQKPEDCTPKECPCGGWCYPRGDMEMTAAQCDAAGFQ